MMLLNVYRAYHNAKGNQAWCFENYINAKNIKKAILVRKQLSGLCKRVHIPSCSCNGDSLLIRYLCEDEFSLYTSTKIKYRNLMNGDQMLIKCLISGLFMNTVQLHKNKSYKSLESAQKVKIHPTSCLFRLQPFYCIYTELIQTSKTFMRNISLVDEAWLKEVAPKYFENKILQKFTMTNVYGQLF